MARLVKVAVQIDDDQLGWLEEMAATYDLPSVSAAMRAVLHHAIEQVDGDEIFAPEDGP